MLWQLIFGLIAAIVVELLDTLTDRLRVELKETEPVKYASFNDQPGATLCLESNSLANQPKNIALGQLQAKHQQMQQMNLDQLAQSQFKETLALAQLRQQMQSNQSIYAGTNLAPLANQLGSSD